MCHFASVWQVQKARPSCKCDKKLRSYRWKNYTGIFFQNVKCFQVSRCLDMAYISAHFLRKNWWGISWPKYFNYELLVLCFIYVHYCMIFFAVIKILFFFQLMNPCLRKNAFQFYGLFIYYPKVFYTFLKSIYPVGKKFIEDRKKIIKNKKVEFPFLNYP